MTRRHRRRDARPAVVGTGRGYSDNAFRVALRESATATVDAPTAAVSLAETTTHANTGATGAGGHQLVLLISAGWGSSGYYSPELLAEAARKRLFHAGLPMYLDHPTLSEDQERPERSVRDLAAVLTEDAYYDPQRKALVAQARVFAPYREMLTDLAEHIGLSIRAEGMSEHGTVDGRSGPIIKEITAARSVDYVTQAGRGGKVLALLESARNATLREARSFGGWLESRLHLTLTQYADEAYGDGRLTREERIVLSAAIGDGLQAWTARVEADAPQLFTRDLHEEPPAEANLAEATTPDDTPTDTETVGEATPEDPPADHTGQGAHDNPATGTAPDNTGQEGVMPDTTDTEAVQAREAAEALAAAQAKLAEAERKAAEAEAKATEIEAKHAAMQAVEAARPITTRALAESDLPAAARDRVMAAVTAQVPLTEHRTLDETALTALIEAQVTAEAAYVAELREAAGAGQVTGMGSTSALRESATNSTTDTQAVQASLIEAYKQRGMSETAAKLAATGRAF